MTDVTKTPRKKRRISNEFIPLPESDIERQGGQVVGEDDDSIAQTPVPHGLIGSKELGADQGICGINEDVKELMRIVKRELNQLIHCVSHIKTWVQLDSIHVPKFNIQTEITGIEKWAMETLESLPAYHTKRGQLLRDLSSSQHQQNASQDMKEAVVELDDFQMTHLLMTLQETVQISAVLYTHLESVVVEDV
ncbi:UNVERIFIED_CONTAM: hypothetical protein HDU68_009557 [Siphonaria sp. JEL0065]|nr:hypothetical protein HDU68_009557 [Siphonaria sp. JEL0065]